jgi:hypothetical protein
MRLFESHILRKYHQIVSESVAYCEKVEHTVYDPLHFCVCLYCDQADDIEGSNNGLLRCDSSSEPLDASAQHQLWRAEYIGDVNDGISWYCSLCSATQT